MKVPLRWLEDFVPVDKRPKELANRLTMSGTLVERVTNSGSALDEILVAMVTALESHPNANSLWLATVDLGNRTQVVVTGASNLFVGALVPFIGVGHCLPGEVKPLEGRMLRGVRSEGMVCSGKELGLSNDDAGILILDRSVLGVTDLAAVRLGAPVSDYIGDWVLDLEITPNRPDCLSIYGVAREVAAIDGGSLTPIPQPSMPEPDPPNPGIELEILDPDLCPRISASVVTNAQVGESPSWLIARLNLAGIRSINNIVDATNYVMLELGQPLHAYDLDTLHGRSLRVRRARSGERLTTLDGVERPLSPDMLLIADDDRAIGIAGVMGGQDTEVGAGTRNVLLEAATFNGRNIRRTSVALGLRSEASSRFEKGLPLQLAAVAARRAACLIAELAGGTVASRVLWTGDPDPEPRVIAFSVAEVNRILGVDWDPAASLGSLAALGFTLGDSSAGMVAVHVPWWRQDIVEGADLVEEVARIVGFEEIPETMLRGGVTPRPVSNGQTQYPHARAILLAAGLHEGSSPSLINARDLEMLRPDGADERWLAQIVPNAAPIAGAGSTFEPVRVVNPLTPERELLRPTLLPGLLAAVRDNLRAGEGRVAFFELDTCAFARPGNLPIERRSLAIAIAGDRYDRSWSHDTSQFDYYDLKGCVELLVERLGVSGAEIVGVRHDLLHPGRSAILKVGGVSIGFLGELEPRIAERWDLDNHRTFVCEIDFDALADRCVPERRFEDYPRQPLVKRDLAVIVDQSRSAAHVHQEIRGAAKGLLRSATLFDVYQGSPLPLDKKSLAYALTFQAGDRTLADAEVDKVIGRIRKTLEHRVGAEFRL
jgi:phenylalanyl-tRNA synthetase beta chain